MNFPAPKTSSPRYLFLDILRGIAAFWMIPTHVLGVLLNTQAQENSYYQIFLPTTGYVAVAFIFCAGSASWYSLERKANLYRSFTPELWQHLKRTAFILLTAYWFNISTTSWLQLKNSPLAIQKCLAFDVLQVIGFSILIFLLLIQFIHSVKVLKWILLIVALGIYASAPLVWGLDFSKSSVFIKSVLGRPPDTAFPFFPWVGHFFMGAALTGIFSQFEKKFYFMAALLILSCLAPSIIFYVNGLPFQYPGWQEDWWFCNPGNSFLRLSKVTFLFSSLYLCEALLQKIKAFLSPLILFSKESLQIYVFHIIIVYGRPFWRGLDSFYAHQLTLWQGLGFTLALTLFSFVMAWLWHRLKETKPFLAKAILATYIIGFLIYFFF